MYVGQNLSPVALRVKISFNLFYKLVSLHNSVDFLGELQNYGNSGSSAILSAFSIMLGSNLTSLEMRYKDRDKCLPQLTKVFL